jgi:small subunit ribosomal protein S35
MQSIGRTSSHKLLTKWQNHNDMFDDIPLDTRHHTVKTKPKFPKEWRMTDERRQELQHTRQQSFLVDQTKVSAGLLVDGQERIKQSLAPPPELVPERVGKSTASRTPVARR